MTIAPSFTSVLPENEQIEACAPDGSLTPAGEAQVSRLAFRILELQHMAVQLDLQRASAIAALVAAMQTQSVDRVIAPMPDGNRSTALLVEADPNAGWLRPKFTEIPLLLPGDHP